MKALPPIPSSIWGILGPIDVVRAASLDDGGSAGLWEADVRRISVLADLPPAVAWWTFWHEHTHSVLDDLRVTLPSKLEEKVCDAIASARTMELVGHSPEVPGIAAGPRRRRPPKVPVVPLPTDPILP